MNNIKQTLAKNLLREINTYLKQAKVQKKAFYPTSESNADVFKEIWSYWACASLTKLKSMGVERLDQVEVPTPSKGETAQEYGLRALGRGNSELKKLLNEIWEGGAK